VPIVDFHHHEGDHCAVNSNVRHQSGQYRHMSRARESEDSMSLGRLGNAEVVDHGIFRDVVGRFASDLTVITTTAEGK
jgi:hypothetical protein